MEYFCSFCHAVGIDQPPHGTGPCPEFLREHEARLEEMKAKTELLHAQAEATRRPR